MSTETESIEQIRFWNGRIAEFDSNLKTLETAAGCTPGTLQDAASICGRINHARTASTVAWLCANGGRFKEAYSWFNSAQVSYYIARHELLRPEIEKGMDDSATLEMTKQRNRAHAKLPRRGDAMKAAIQSAMAREHAVGVQFKVFMQRWEMGDIEAPPCTDLGNGRYRVEGETPETFKDYTIGTLAAYYAQS